MTRMPLCQDNMVIELRMNNNIIMAYWQTTQSKTFLIKSVDVTRIKLKVNEIVVKNLNVDLNR
jgi:hypothetical protein